MKKDQKRQVLFKEALILFSIHGYKKTTIEDVAGKLGMTKGNLYFYVKNKAILPKLPKIQKNAISQKKKSDFRS